MHPRQQTIFALSSGRPPSAIAIVRVSGPEAGAALGSLAGKRPVPRMATRVLLRDANQQPIDDAVVKEVWGHLPDKLRQQVSQYYKEQFMPKYSDLLKQYYSSLANVPMKP